MLSVSESDKIVKNALVKMDHYRQVICETEI